MVTLGPYDYSGPSTRFYGDGWVAGRSEWWNGNYSVMRAMVTCYNGPSGSTGSFHSGWGRHMQGFDGVGWVVNHERTPFLPSGVPQNGLRWQESGDVNVGHDGNGNHGGLNTRLHVEYGGGGGVNSEWIAYVGLPRIPRPPTNAPCCPAVINPSPTSLTYQFSGSGVDDGGSGITSWEAQWSTSSDFSTGNGSVVTSTGTSVFTGLAPGTIHYFHARAVNAYGAGPWGATISQTTLPAVAPGLTVTAAPSGESAVLTFSPPGGSSGVTKYTWERRLTSVGGAASASGDFVGTTSGSNTGLTPGTSYDWRGSAWFGTYQSPISDWAALVMPKPNVSPGEYYDGATVPPAGSDVSYAWTGTANLSTSQMLGKAVSGWLSFANGNPSAGATGQVYQITGGVSGQKAARLVCFTDQTTPGLSIGTDLAAANRAVVTVGATYFGSIYVRTSKANRGCAAISWINAAGTVFATSYGVEAQIASETWTRFTASGVAPVGAVGALVLWILRSGTGYVAMLSGDTITADAAMLTLGELFPYFDGSTPDDTTYSYDWVDVSLPHASASSRTAVVGGGVDPLEDPLCPPPPAPPRAPVVLSECIEPPSIWRRYWQEISQEEISDWLAVIPTVKIRSDASVQSQVRVRIYENPSAIPAAAFTGINEWISEQIISYMPAYTIITLDGVAQRAWAQVGSATVDPNTVAMRPADKLLYGTNGTPPTWPVLSCGLDYLISFDSPVENPVDLRRFVSLTERLG